MLLTQHKHSSPIKYDTLLDESSRALTEQIGHCQLLLQDIGEELQGYFDTEREGVAQRIQDAIEDKNS